MRTRRFGLIAGCLVALALAPASARGSAAESVPTCPADRQIADRLGGVAPALCVVADHAHREGMFLVIEALVRNISGRPMTRAEVGVECYTYSGDLLAVEDTVLRPDRLGPGQEGTLLVLTPWQDGIEKIRYLVTWQQADRQHQGAVELEVPPSDRQAGSPHGIKMRSHYGLVVQPG
jgi:hypothetical protein